jgi:hypothetical protein
MLRPICCLNVKGSAPYQQVKRHVSSAFLWPLKEQRRNVAYPPAIREAATGIFFWAAWGLYDAIKRNEFKHIDFSHGSVPSSLI